MKRGTNFTWHTRMARVVSGPSHEALPPTSRMNSDTPWAMRDMYDLEIHVLAPINR